MLMLQRSYDLGPNSSGRVYGESGSTANTLAEFSINSWNGLDFYDLSVIDGYNLPMQVRNISVNKSLQLVRYVVVKRETSITHKLSI